MVGGSAISAGLSGVVFSSGLAWFTHVATGICGSAEPDGRPDDSVHILVAGTSYLCYL